MSLNTHDCLDVYVDKMLGGGGGSVRNESHVLFKQYIGIKTMNKI